MTASQAYCQFWDGTDLVEGLIEYEKGQEGKDFNPGKSIKYMSYVVGAVDGLEVQGELCIETGVKDSQVLAIVAKYLKANPEKWAQSGYSLVKEALKPVWACKDGSVVEIWKQTANGYKDLVNECGERLEKITPMLDKLVPVLERCSEELQKCKKEVESPKAKLSPGVR